jgi:hypothetical protein
MKPTVALAVLLTACVPHAPQPAVATVCPEVQAVAPPVAAPAAPTPAVTATKGYHAAEARESGAVTKGDATVGYITEIHSADQMAREALRQLVAQDGHPTATAIAAAKRSLDDLVSALEATPQ